MTELVYSLIKYNANSKSSYLWFIGSPSSSVIIFLRKDGWSYNDKIKKWVYKQHDKNGFNHAKNIQKRLYFLYKIEVFSDSDITSKNILQTNSTIDCGIYRNKETGKIYITFSKPPQYDVFDFLRKDKWFYDGIENQWRYSELNNVGYNHALKTLDILCQKFKFNKLGTYYKK